MMVIRPAPGLPLEPMAHGVLHQGLQGQERDSDGQHLGRDPQRHLQPVTEPGLLQHEVALDRAELFGQAS